MQGPLNMKNRHARVVVPSWVCLNESLHVQYHDDQSLENIYKIRVTLKLCWKTFSWIKLSSLRKFDTNIVAEEFDFGQLQERQLPFGVAFLQFAFYDLPFLWLLLFSELIHCHFSKKRGKIPKYILPRGTVADCKIEWSFLPWIVFFGVNMIHFQTCYMRLGQETSMNLYQVSENIISKLLNFLVMFGYIWSLMNSIFTFSSRGILIKHSLRDKLCRIEFCHPCLFSR